MDTIIEMGKISSRGQVAIPSGIREHMGLKEGSKILFLTEDDTLLIKKVTLQSFAEITKPLKEVMKKSKIKEKDVPGIIHRMRKNR